MGKKFGIRKLSWKAGHQNSKGKSRPVSHETGQQERWQAFENKLAQRMNSSAKDKSRAPTLLNNTGNPQKIQIEEDDVDKYLVPPSELSERSEWRSETASPEPLKPTSPELPPLSPHKPPVSPRHSPASPSYESPATPKLKPVSAEIKLSSPSEIRPASFRNKWTNRLRAGSESESSFASGQVKIVPTGSFSEKSKGSKASKASKVTLKAGKKSIPPQRYDWKTESLLPRPSDEASTDESTHDYSSGSDDSITFYTKDTKETYNTKETAYTYFTMDEVGLVERLVLRIANMFVCDFDDGHSPCRSHRKSR